MTGLWGGRVFILADTYFCTPSAIFGIFGFSGKKRQRSECEKSQQEPAAVYHSALACRNLRCPLRAARLGAECGGWCKHVIESSSAGWSQMSWELLVTLGWPRNSISVNYFDSFIAKDSWRMGLSL
jgi:hypothetical protein